MSDVQIVQQPLRRNSDPVRPVGRVRVELELNHRVVNMPCRAWKTDGVSSGGHVKIKRGESPKVERVVYADELHKLEALVENDEDAIRQAKRAYERKLEAFKKQHKGQKGEAEFGGSIEAEFCDLTGRGIKPLRAVHLVEDNLPAPESEEDKRQKQMVELMAQAIARAGGVPRRGRPPKSDSE